MSSCAVTIEAKVISGLTQQPIETARRALLLPYHLLEGYTHHLVNVRSRIAGRYGGILSLEEPMKCQ